MRMSVVVDPVSGGTGTTNTVPPHGHGHQSQSSSSSFAGGPSSEEELLVVNTATNSSSTPSGSPTPLGASNLSLLTTSTALSASTTTMVGQQQPSPIPGSGPGSFVSATTPPTSTNFEDVVKTGNLRKVKGRKKYFVLRKESENGSIPARLEYYANERKFKLGQSPKKSIILKHCFNISRTDSKCKYAIALHTHNDCVRIAMSSEEEMNEWLRTINSLAGDDEEDQFLPAGGGGTQGGGDDSGTVTSTTTLIPKPHFEHVWLVTALNKGLGSKENIIGPYRLCLTSKELTLLKVGDHDEKNSVGILKFPLNVIRNVSHDAAFGCFFHIEFGRLAPTGPGQLSLKTEDNNIAQNMHLLILKAMQNYSKEDMIPRETRRGRTYTWNSAYNDSNSSSSRHSSFHHAGGPNNHHGTTPPIMTRINSLDGSTMRLRTESIGSQESRTTGMSPPMPIMGHHGSGSMMNPSLSFNSPMCSTTDSASSSYSNDYENNNNNNSNRGLTAYHQQQHSYGRSQDEEEDESYVPWNPADDQHHSSTTTVPAPSANSLLTLHLKQNSINSNSRHDGNASHNEDDYVETTVGSGGGCVTVSSTSVTPSSHIDTQSPISPFDNYLPMSPGTPLSSGENVKHSSSAEKHKTSVPHSRTSSNAIEEHEGYVPMLPGTQHSEAPAGSTTGLDETYFDMDFSKKLNLSNDDFRRMSPASSESLQSSTPSSDFPLEKVSSYLLSSDDLDDSSGRPMRAYSVGSRSDTTAIGKGRFGKNRLEAVQETFRMRALSVGAKIPKPNTVASAMKTTPETAKKEKASTASITSISSSVTAPLSNSWSGSTGKWPPHKFSTPAAIPASVTTPQIPAAYHHSQQNSDSVDSDLMELDFSHNKKNRKRSLPGSTHLSLGSGGNQGSVGSSIGSGGGPKLSPALLKSGCETPETPSEGSKGSPFIHQYGSSPGVPSAKYPCSAPISIQKTKSSCGDDGDYMDTSGGVSILTRMTGLAVKEIKQLDNDGAYMDMSFGNPTAAAAPTTKSSSTPALPTTKNCAKTNPVVIKPNESVPPSVFTLNTTSSGTSPTQQHSISSSPKLAFFGLTSVPSGAAPLSYMGTGSPLQASSHKSTVSPPAANLLHPPATSGSTSSSPNSTSSLTRIEESPEKQEFSRSTSQTDDDENAKITYAKIDHSCLESGSPHKKPVVGVSPLVCGKSSAPDSDSSKVTYSQVEFVKSSDAAKRN